MSDPITNNPVSIGNVDSSYQAAGVVVLTAAFAGRRYVAGGFCKSTAFALEVLKKNNAAAEWHKAGDAYLSSAKKNFLNDVKVALLAGAAAGATLYAKDNFSFDGTNATVTPEEQPASTTPATTPTPALAPSQEEAPAPTPAAAPTQDESAAPKDETPASAYNITCQDVPGCEYVQYTYENLVYPSYTFANHVAREVFKYAFRTVQFGYDKTTDLASKHPIVATGLAAAAVKFTGGYLNNKVNRAIIAADIPNQVNQAIAGANLPDLAAQALAAAAAVPAAK